MRVQTLRIATPDDAATLARLLRDFNREFHDEVDELPVLTRRFGRFLLEDTVLTLLAEESNAPTGFAIFTLRPAIWFDGPVAVLDELYVVPKKRSKGIGASLLARGRELLLGRGCPEIHINVDGEDTDARRFYERHGFINREAGREDQMLCYIGPTKLP